MSRDGSLTLPFADGDYTFRLAWGELILLQEALDAGPFVVSSRLFSGGWGVKDISEVIRLGLIGGGAVPARALSLVRTYVEARPPLETVALAQAILGAALGLTVDEAPGEAGAAPETENA